MRAHKPDVAIIDIRMPPTHTDEGLRAAHEIRAELPDTGVLVLSQYVEEGYALDLLADSAEGVGYLLKDRVGDVDASSTPSGAWPTAGRRSTRRSSRSMLGRKRAATIRSRS